MAGARARRGLPSQAPTRHGSWHEDDERMDRMDRDPWPHKTCDLPARRVLRSASKVALFTLDNVLKCTDLAGRDLSD